MKTIPELVIAWFTLAASDAVAQPTITTQPKSQSVGLGAKVTFNVRASGIGIPIATRLFAVVNKNKQNRKT